MEGQPGATRPRFLPFQLSSFVGRESELAQVETAVLRHRLVTLTGAGGVGKSRLAFEVASRLASEFPDGVFAVELASLGDPGLVPPTIARALGIVDQPDEALVDALAAHLSERELLLVLDNCEHVLERCAPLVETLLCRCGPDLRLLATSRQPLRIPGEIVWLVPPLAAPSLRSPAHDGAQPVRHGSIEACDSVRLFVERAQAAAQDFRLTERNGWAIAEICARLGGLPLAIELAAGRANALTPEEINDRLAGGLGLLAGGASGALPHHRTMTAAIDWSYSLLDPYDSATFRRLSVFRGGWRLDAAAAICVDALAPGTDIADTLTRLVERSLVVAQAQGAEMRYGLLEPVRQFSDERLREAGEAFNPLPTGPLDCGAITSRTQLFVLAPVGLECSMVEPYPFYGADEAGLNACVDGFSWSGLTWSLDGVPIEVSSDYIVRSPMYKLRWGEDNALGMPEPGKTWSVVRAPFLMFAPLAPGKHTIELHGVLADPDGSPFAGDATLLVTVE